MKDIAIVGGGLGGLVSAILLARKGLSVVLYEKKQYPFHRVCGEYVSNEVVPFLQQHDLYPDNLHPTSIRRLWLTSVSGDQAELDLDMGGFGISRYALDHFLYQKAVQAGVDCRTLSKVEDVIFADDSFDVISDNGKEKARLVIGAHGKRSLLDKKLQRGFMLKRSPYVAVKYHVKLDFPEDTIALHNFNGGYCGLSKVEGEKYNLCYLGHRDGLKSQGNIDTFEKEVLHKNPHLRQVLMQAEKVQAKPLVINEVSFVSKSVVENHILMVGDAAGMIAPLCGNGMAIAIRSAHLLVGAIAKHYSPDGFDRKKLEQEYRREWQKAFRVRLWAGRNIQQFLFGTSGASALALKMAKIKPLANSLVRMTHGKEFW